MRRLLLLVLVAGLVGLPAVAHADTVTLDGVRVRVTTSTGQVVTVNRTRGYHARVTLWTHTDQGWTRGRQVTDSRIGYGGLVRGSEREQGTGTTPLGSYRLMWAFGTHPRAEGWQLRYRRVGKGDFWVQDNRSAYYNRYRNKANGGFRWWLPGSNDNASERLTDFKLQYEYSIVTSFNRQQVRHRGSGIFLHVNGTGATGGCISAPRPFLARLMRRLDPASRPVIAIGR